MKISKRKKPQQRGLGSLPRAVQADVNQPSLEKSRHGSIINTASQLEP